MHVVTQVTVGKGNRERLESVPLEMDCNPSWSPKDSLSVSAFRNNSENEWTGFSMHHAVPPSGILHLLVYGLLHCLLHELPSP